MFRAGAGYNNIDIAAATEANIAVCNCPGQNSIAVAELVFGLMLSIDRKIVESNHQLSTNVWNKLELSENQRGMFGRTLGVLGAGNIGCEVMKRAAAFGEILSTSSINMIEFIHFVLNLL